jgi:hypothetical protein
LGLVVLAAFGLWAVDLPTAFADGTDMARRFEPLAFARFGGPDPLLLMSPLGERETAFFFNIRILHTSIPGMYE